MFTISVVDPDSYVLLTTLTEDNLTVALGKARTLRLQGFFVTITI